MLISFSVYNRKTFSEYYMYRVTVRFRTVTRGFYSIISCSFGGKAL